MSSTRSRLLICSLIVVIGCVSKNSEKVADGTDKNPTVALKNSQPENDLLGLPGLPVPKDNLITKEKVALGKRLFEDQRFSTTGKVSCSTCHEAKTGFTDSPLQTSKGINDLRGTRNAPTILNAAFNKTQFWDGRSPSLEDQAQHPFVNPVEMALPNHQPILEVIKQDPEYLNAFKAVFGLSPEKIKIVHVTRAIATFERTLIAGNSRFDRWYFNGEDTLSKEEKNGFQVFIGNGRCVSCHAIEHTSAMFTDHQFHNIGVGINRVPQTDVDRLTSLFLVANYNTETVDKKVLNEPKTSELGRFAVTQSLTEVGSFKTSTLRNIDLTAPYMHDGSLKTLEEVVDHYNRGGASSDEEKINPYMSGGIRPLNLTEDEKKQLVAFMKTLTSGKFE